MKTLITLILIAFSLNVSAQSPQGINYQAVIRNSNGVTVNNTQVGLRIRIIQGTSNGTPVYAEAFTETTSNIGLINVVVGEGSVIAGAFNSINWASGPYFIEVAADINGGSNYTVMGTQQMMSVPYALYAENSGTAGPQGPQGIQGPQGSQGLSAYQIWLGQGNIGTEQDFLNSLVGPQGQTGNSSTSPESRVPNSVFLMSPTNTYTVPSGKIAKISNVLVAQNTPLGPSFLKINNTNIYVCDGKYYWSNQSSLQEGEKYIVTDGDIWLPSGSSIEVLQSAGVQFLSVQEFDIQPSFTVKLITTNDIVPSNKKWRIMSFLPSSASSLTSQYLFKINNISLVASYGIATNSQPDDKLFRSIINGEIWLPQQTSLSPFTGIYGIVVLEY